MQIYRILEFPIKFLLSFFPFMVQLSTASIGHFCFEFDISEHKRKKIEIHSPIRGRYVLYYQQRRISNQYLLQLVKRERMVIPFWLGHLVFRLQSRFGVISGYLFEEFKDKSVSQLVTVHTTKPCLAPSDNEIQDCINFIASKVDSSRPLVLIAIRDSGYDEYCVRKGFADKGILTRQAFRNGDINDYRDSILYLLQAGYSVVRVGRHNNVGLLEKLENYYDYSLDYNNHNDRYDVLMHKIAKFCISTGTGVDELSNLFRHRIYNVNFTMPGSRTQSHLNPIFLLQDYIDPQSQNKIPLHEVLDTSLFDEHPNKLKVEKGILVRQKSGYQLLSFIQLVISIEKSLESNSNYFSIDLNLGLETSRDGRYFY